MPETNVPVEIPDWMMARLSVLIDPEQGLPDLAAVIGKLLDHVQQGVYRPGAWERSWLEQAFGDYWLDRLEPDPGTPFERPIPPRPDGPPEWEHHAYGVGLSAGEFEDDPIVGGGHIDPRRFIASCSSLARSKWQLRLEDITAAGTIYAAISHRWAAWIYGEVFRDGNWRTGWLLDREAPEDGPGAFPVTVLVPDWRPADRIEGS